MKTLQNNIAIIFKEKKIPYDELSFYVSLLKEKINANADARVIICLENRPEWLFALFAIWEKKSVAVPLDHLATPEEISHIIRDSMPELIIFSKKTEENVIKGANIARYEKSFLFIDDIEFNPPEKKLFAEWRFDIGEFDEDDIALLLYTSGTSGPPKGVILSFGNIKSNILALSEAEIARPGDKVLACLPFHHSYPLMINLVASHIGATIVIIEKISKEEIFLSLLRHKADIFIGVPRIYELFHKSVKERIASSRSFRALFAIAGIIKSMAIRKLLFFEAHKKFGGKIRYFISGGARLDPDIINDFERMGFKFLEGYGLTETSPVISFNRPEARKNGSAGKILSGVFAKIVDDEIWVKGKNVMRGYWRNDEKTRQAFSGEWFKTGDSGYIDEDGFLFITGRKKDIIVLSNGKKINPEEIEARLTKISPLIKEAAVVAENDRLKALVFPDMEAFNREKILNIKEKIKWDVIDAYNRTAPSHRKISGFEILKEELPKTRLGKIKRFLLESKKHENSEIQKKNAENEPDDTNYKAIKDFISTLTNAKVFPSSHIEIDLGLDSLDKVELLSFIETRFGISASENELSEIQVVKDLYQFVKNRKTRDLSMEDITWSKILREDIEVDVKETAFYILLLKSVLSPFFNAYFRTKIEGIENAPFEPCIFAPNHQSYLDGFLIAASLPKKILEHTFFIASDVCFETKIRKAMAKRFHVIVMNKDMNLKESLLKGANILRRQKSLVIFPEGAITRDGNLQEFRPSFAILSKEFNVPVAPIRIKGLFELYKIHETFFPKRGDISIKYLPIVRPNGKSVDEIVKETFEKISFSS